MQAKETAPPHAAGPDPSGLKARGQRAGLVVEEPPELVPLELPVPVPMLLEPVPELPELVLLFGTMPGGHLLAALDMLLVLLLLLELLGAPAALEVPAGTQSLADSELLGVLVLEPELGLLVLPPELV